MRHGRAAFLSFAKIFFHFQDFRSLKMTKFRCPAIDAGSDHRQRRHEFSVSVPLHDLGRKRSRFQSKFLTHGALNCWIDMCVGADRTADFADANSLESLRQAFLRSTEFVEHEREL